MPFYLFHRAILRSQHQRMWNHRAVSKQRHVPGHDWWIHLQLWRWLVRRHVWRQPQRLRQCDVSTWRHLCGRHCELYLLLSTWVYGSVCKCRGQSELIWFDCRSTDGLTQLVSAKRDGYCITTLHGEKKVKSFIGDLLSFFLFHCDFEGTSCLHKASFG